NTADPDVADGKAPAAAGFNQVVDFFAWTEAVPEIADCAEVDEIRADADQVIGNPAELGEDHADVLSAFRYFDAEHFLDGHRICDAVHHGRHVIQAISEGNHLPVHVGLGHLFKATMEKADFRVGIEDLFAIGCNLKPECPVHRRM